MIQIVCCTDDNYAFNFAVLAQSILDHHPADAVAFHLMHSELSEYSSRGIQEFARASGIELHTYPIDESIFENLPRISYFGIATYFRFLIPELLPATLDRVLYLDMDIIVDGRLEPLWATPLEGCSAAVVEDGVPAHLGALAPATYFNAGVMLINMAYWRTEDVKGRALAAMMEHAAIIRYGDQDALNIVLANSKRMVDRKWNAHMMMDKALMRRAARGQIGSADRPVVIHFNQKIKPWMFNCKHAYTRQYREILSRTPFKDQPIKNAGLGSALFYLTPKPLRGLLWSKAMNARLGR